MIQRTQRCRCPRRATAALAGPPRREGFNILKIVVTCNFAVAFVFNFTFTFTFAFAFVCVFDIDFLCVSVFVAAAAAAAISAAAAAASISAVVAAAAPAAAEACDPSNSPASPKSHGNSAVRTPVMASCSVHRSKRRSTGTYTRPLSSST